MEESGVIDMPYMFNEDKTKANVTTTTLKASKMVNIPANGYAYIYFSGNYPGTLLSVRRSMTVIVRKSDSGNADMSKIILGDVSVSSGGAISYPVYNNNDYEITVFGGSGAGENACTVEVVSVR